MLPFSYTLTQHMNSIGLHTAVMHGFYAWTSGMSVRHYGWWGRRCSTFARNIKAYLTANSIYLAQKLETFCPTPSPCMQTSQRVCEFNTIKLPDVGVHINVHYWTCKCTFLPSYRIRWTWNELHTCACLLTRKWTEKKKKLNNGKRSLVN